MQSVKGLKKKVDILHSVITSHFTNQRGHLEVVRKSPRIDVFDMFTQIFPELTADEAKQIAKLQVTQRVVSVHALTQDGGDMRHQTPANRF